MQQQAAILDPGHVFRILVCIDGSEESYRGLRYAVRLARGFDTDITLLNIRKVDKELSTGGLDMRLSRENMLDWGLDLPGRSSLKKGLETLKDLGYLDGEWSTATTHIDNSGDPLGDNMVEYTNQNGRKVTLKLIVAPTASLGILDEAEAGNYDITIVSEIDPEEDEILGKGRSFTFSSSTSQRVATEANSSVIVVRALEENLGHLVCLSASEASLKMAVNDAIMAIRCNCPVYLYTVVAEASEVDKGQAILERAKSAIEEAGYQIEEIKVGIGDPVECIIEEGRSHSLIVMSGEHKIGFRRFFKSSILFKVLEGAENSVLLRR